MRAFLVLSLMGAACSEPDRTNRRGSTVTDGDDTAVEEPTVDTGAPTPSEEVWVTDEAALSGYQDLAFGSWQRGRAVVLADLDADGRLDVVSGNPGDTSYVLRNVTPEGGALRFAVGQVLAEESVFWGGAASDMDNDGDLDVLVSVGGNEGSDFDRYMENDGAGGLTDVSTASGLWQVLPDGTPIHQSTASVIQFDYDNDGLLDVFGNSTVRQPALVGQLEPEAVTGLNPLYHNEGGGRFVEQGRLLGLTTQLSTRNSAVLDFDNDGDFDLFENNWIGPNVLWRNELVETGEPGFVDVTAEMALAGGDLTYPRNQSGMCAIASDLNNDGWDDLVVLRRWPKSEEVGEPIVHGDTHLVWLNVEGTGFVEVSSLTGLAGALQYRDHAGEGVMGCQIGDVDADGFPDLFIGNGGPEAGAPNQLFVSAGLRPASLEIDGVGRVRVPQWEDWSHLIDFPAEHLERHEPSQEASYPYRTHGSAFGDFDGDGYHELAVHNGGPSTKGTDEQMQEPNRLFRFQLPVRNHWLRLQLVGDGVTVNTDGIGARVRALVTDGKKSWEVFETKRGATGFGAQNDPEVLIGLGAATTVLELEITWPDGHVQTIQARDVDRRLRIER